MGLSKVNWYDRDSVIAYAKMMGTGYTVFKHPSNKNYNITFTKEQDRYRPEWVVHQT